MNRTDFPILNQKVHNRPLIYLDNAATTQKPQQVLDAIELAYTTWNSNIHRGVHHLSQVATAKHEESRQKVANFIGAKSAKEIIFTKGTTDSINMLARCFGDLSTDTFHLNPGDEILLSEVEHHSNIVPWQMLCERKKCVIRVFKQGEVPEIKANTKLISVAYVSNVLGIQNRIADIIKVAHEHDIPVVIDAAQAAPHLPIDVQALDCDFLVLSGHKMYGPTGIGVLYGKEAWLNILPPAEGGGEMIEHVSWERTTYNVLPYKFEAGTPNFIGSYALGIAIDYIKAISITIEGKELQGMEAIAAHEAELCKYAETKLHELNDTIDQTIHIYADGMPKSGAISFNVFMNNGTADKPATLIHPFDIGTLLDQQGVAVRTGHHCAEPLIDSLGVPGTVRISFALYNNHEDIDTFISALARALAMLG